MIKLCIILALLSKSLCFAGWKAELSASDEIRISYAKGDQGEKDVATILAKLKESDQLKHLQSVRFPDFSRDDDYQKRIKAALLKVAPEEARKIFNTKGEKPWSYYHALELKLRDAYTELEEFKGMKIELAKVGYRLGMVRAEKFSYSSFLSPTTGELRLIGIHPSAQIEPIIPSAKPSADQNIFIQLGKQIEMNSQHYLSLSIYPLDDKKLQIKGKWSPSLKAYLISAADVYQHDGNNWQLVRKVTGSISNTLTFNKNNAQKLLLPITKLKHANKANVIEIGKQKLHSGIENIDQ